MVKSEEYKIMEDVLDQSGYAIEDFNLVISEFMVNFTADPNHKVKSVGQFKKFLINNKVDEQLECFGELPFNLVDTIEYISYIGWYYKEEFPVTDVTEEKIEELKLEYVSDWADYFHYDLSKTKEANEIVLYEKMVNNYNIDDYSSRGLKVIPWTYTSYNKREGYFDNTGETLEEYVSKFTEVYFKRNIEFLVNEAKYDFELMLSERGSN